jgi:hypothetical protein
MLSGPGGFCFPLNGMTGMSFRVRQISGTSTLRWKFHNHYRLTKFVHHQGGFETQRAIQTQSVYHPHVQYVTLGHHSAQYPQDEKQG